MSGFDLPNTGAIAPWLNCCDDKDTTDKKFHVDITHISSSFSDKLWGAWVLPEGSTKELDYCKNLDAASVTNSDDASPDYRFSTYIEKFKAYGHDCFYKCAHQVAGNLICDGVSGIRCDEHPSKGKVRECDGPVFRDSARCSW